MIGGAHDVIDFRLVQDALILLLPDGRGSFSRDGYPCAMFFVKSDCYHI
ncbi:hypothetical protein [Chengkuizengella axinellae]|uniref:Uncharacterized protein n=1 Tax=Chengkuizengella axinellae TaxID=3064388 RepID=A0ABT9ITZ6_9BACL|nr:hypothetical protein [Chengkuizengella sp. 2205SS18-9]MDP5272813.1 hypothetical protein [Chengkuizengella sp. 2205SS18-9]